MGVRKRSPYVSTLSPRSRPNRAWREGAPGGENSAVKWLSITSRARVLLQRLGGGIEDAIVPNACVFCGTWLPMSRVPVCGGCHADLPWIGQQCARCARPVETRLPDGIHCAPCQLDPPPFTAAVVPLLYTFPIDAAIKAMKFRRRLHYLPAFTALLTTSLPDLPDDIDALLAVPLHWRRQTTRGFNQAAELCKPLAARLGVPIIRNVLRIRSTTYQSGLHARERQRNLHAAFTARGVIAARHALIIDDVITTGETCRHLAQVVLDAGAEKVSVLAIARAAG